MAILAGTAKVIWLGKQKEKFGQIIKDDICFPFHVPFIL
jgi:hypothetical protein